MLEDGLIKHLIIKLVALSPYSPGLKQLLRVC